MSFLTIGRSYSFFFLFLLCTLIFSNIFPFFHLFHLTLLSQFSPFPAPFLYLVCLLFLFLLQIINFIVHSTLFHHFLFMSIGDLLVVLNQFQGYFYVLYGFLLLFRVVLGIGSLVTTKVFLLIWISYPQTNGCTNCNMETQET